ncbi:zonular occludens toxin domain-containing protein [Vibrio parahaemolyticus]|nr:zonular occludens toxin domain-containing protein [Vibrio parahaemolyticus]MDF4752406.1 zonular occludens toxin domain-containing protein [Vibrio parahaemolyticus]
MATIIRHGPAGSYKSSYAVWFELLPALREGRICVTNVEGMKTLEEIESRLGERFPISARLIRISSQTTKGKKLWQNFYNWLPLGAFALIDEAQDIYSKTQGFNIDKNVYQGIETFADTLPPNFIDLYERTRQTFKPKEVYVDDIGEKIIDEQGNIIMPADFRESLQRHRKYNWDLVFCTPNIKYIGDEVKSVSEFAVSHSSRDGILPWSKRKTRLYNHDPRSTTIKPSKDDQVDIKKIPVAVHLLYSSTSTGAITQTKKGRPLWKEPKLIMAAICFIVAFSVFIDGLLEVTNDSSTNISSLPTNSKTQPGTQQAFVSDSTTSQTSSQVGAAGQEASNHSGEMGDNSNLHSIGHAPSSRRFIDSAPSAMPFDFKKIYVSAIVAKHYANQNFQSYDITLEGVDHQNQSHYVNGSLLSRLGFEILVLDNCLIQMNYGGYSEFLTCRTRINHHRAEAPVQIVQNQGEANPQTDKFPAIIQ